jgi:hypothetical protein
MILIEQSESRMTERRMRVAGELGVRSAIVNEFWARKES